LPGALAGICWTLPAYPHNVNVPSLTGAIMCMGVATANSILMVSFAREQRTRKKRRDAAIEAGFVRIRPVLMTALAMIIGHGADGRGASRRGRAKMRRLGRAVSAGLIFATFATLFFVPCVFSLIHGRRELRQSGSPAAAAS